MLISTLELQGFKSFAQKTRVQFDTGITAIVGPNGCGKSNIVDALRWVLGEQRVSMLRSSSMNDVVFNGTSSRKSLGMAEVSLTLLNNKGVLPTEYSDVTITRRLYRSGQSEYLLNNQPVRLKDIMNLFMDTGMGADAYSVIELKMVEEILSDKNQERRRLFEEAAGITRYKDRRKQTRRRLDDTLADLQRVEDVLREVQKNVRSLELQSQRAMKSKEWTSSLERLDQQLHRFEVEKLDAELGPLREAIGELEDEKEKIQAALGDLEAKEAAGQQHVIKAEQAEAKAAQATRHVEQQLQELQSAIAVAKEKVLGEESLIKQYEEDVTQSSADIETLKKVKDTSEASISELDKELNGSTEELEASREAFRAVQQSYSQTRTAVMEAEIALSRLENDLREVQNTRVRLESKIESATGDRDRVHEEITQIQTQATDLQKEMGERQKEANDAAKKVEKAKAAYQKAQNDRDVASEALAEARNHVQKATSEREALQKQKELVQALAESREQDPQSVSDLFESWSAAPSTMRTLSEAVQTDPEHASALAAALGALQFAVLLPNADAIGEAISFLDTHQKGRAHFIDESVLPSLPSSTVHTSSIAHHVRCDAELKPLVDFLLGQVLIAPTLKEAKGLGHDGWVVTHQGERLYGNVAVEAGSSDASSAAGIRLGLTETLQRLDTDIQTQEKVLHQANQDVEKAQASLDALALDTLEQALQKAHEHSNTHQRELHSLSQRRQWVQRRQQELEEQQAQLSTKEDASQTELTDLEPKQTSLETSIKTQREQLDSLKNTLEELDKDRSVQQNRFNNAQLRHNDVKNRVETVESDRRRATENIKTYTRRLEERKTTISQSRQTIENLQATMAQHAKRVDELNDELATAKQHQQACEKASAEARGSMNALDTELRDLRKRKENNTELLHLQQLTLEKKEFARKSYTDHIWETYSLVMDQIEVEVPEDFDPDETRKQIADLRQKLHRAGDINPLAVEEFEQEKERLDFMEGQIVDLQKAEKELTQTIEDINREATERFEKVFGEIRENFKRVFATLFKESDTCDVLLDEEAEDPLEAKIHILANPSGKRPSGISQLSGGEKTLTAIALLFAIYQVKPSPFCVLDEVDAPLDDANIERFASMIRSFAEETQFILITHNKKTMAKAEMMYGVTMPETGVSRLVGVQLGDMDA
ncbi:MAG: chromosome segregation protein SMC [Balneolaceae bacterium]|nr:chromosome segregation protein SMC [Balneolaceae bacterium]